MSLLQVRGLWLLRVVSWLQRGDVISAGQGSDISPGRDVTRDVTAPPDTAFLGERGECIVRQYMRGGAMEVHNIRGTMHAVADDVEFAAWLEELERPTGPNRQTRRRVAREARRALDETPAVSARIAELRRQLRRSVQR